MAVGDAFGARFENQRRDAISLEGEEGVYRDLNRYTDDTQMAIGVAELLVSGNQCTGENLAASLMRVYRRDPRAGYSDLTRSMLEKSPDSAAFLKYLPENTLRDRKSDGAAMRALPIGFLRSRQDVIRSAALSASITHGHPDAIAATVGIALIAHERYYSGTRFPGIIRNILDSIPCLTESSAAYLQQVAVSGWDPDYILGSFNRYGVPYTESIILLGAVIALLNTCGEDPGLMLTEAVRLGGDTDTTACIALGAALIRPGQDTLPEGLISGLEDGEYGRDFLISLGNRLSDTFPLHTSQVPQGKNEQEKDNYRSGNHFL
jgi:ADP-ribosylglycohydrolase